jgi:hypothetical protein
MDFLRKVLRGKERLQVEEARRIVPEVGEYFMAKGNIVAFIYGQCKEVLSAERIYARCYSRAMPEGEEGTFDTGRIIDILSEERFENAKRRGWP